MKHTTLSATRPENRHHPPPPPPRDRDSPRHQTGRTRRTDRQAGQLAHDAPLLRCTAKLLKRLGIGNPGEPPAPQHALGDWYANFLFTRAGHYLLLVSERSRLSVPLSARDLHSFEGRFLQTLSEVLGEIGVPSHQIDREFTLMQPLYLGKTANRSVLGTLNDFGFLAKHWLSPGDLSLYEVNLQLARAPCQPLQSKIPDKETRGILANPIGFQLIDGGLA